METAVTVERGQDATLPLWRAAVVLRVLTLLFALGVIFYHRDTYARPWLAFVMGGVMIGWTVVVAVRYLRPNDKLFAFTVVDLAVCCAVMSTSRLVLTPLQLEGEPVPLVPTVWVTGVVAAGAVCGGPIVGSVFGGVVAAFNFGVRGYVDTDLTRDLMLLVGVGFVLGLAAASSRRSAARLADALRAEAATAERERLARSIHDGVLQVLAHVRRRGAELGGEAAGLAQLAGEQEVALRTLVSRKPPPTTADGTADVGAHLRFLETERVSVSVPATPVPLPAARADELTAAVREALTNVAKHAGDDAKAWVLLEDLGSEIVVSVRDDGVGIPPGRVAEAEQDGHLGIAKSLLGRVADLGGTASLMTAPGEGVEWELRLTRGGR